MKKFRILIIDDELSAREKAKELFINYFGQEKTELIECAYVDYEAESSLSACHTIQKANINNEYFDFAIFGKIFEGEFAHDDEIAPQKIVDYLKVFPYCLQIVFSATAGFFPKKNEPIVKEYYWGINKRARIERIYKLLDLVIIEWMRIFLEKRINQDDKKRIKEAVLNNNALPSIADSEGELYTPEVYLFPLFKGISSKDKIIEILNN